jgi:HEPN domain-containing protein
MTHPSQSCLESTRRSLDAPIVLHTAGRWPQTCFHAQQAVELALKAALAPADTAPPRLHSNAEVLARQEDKVGEALAHHVVALHDLDSYHTATRYPDAMMGNLPSQHDADEALTAATECVNIFERVLDGSS